MSPLARKIEDLIKPNIETLGFELVGVEFAKSGKYSTLKVYIDSENGINVEDCSEVSHQISAILDVEDPINTQYNLEVSSPGIERPLFKLSDYQRFLGCEISCRLKSLLEGKRKLTGEIVQVNERENNIHLLTPVKNYIIDVNNIDKANLIYI
jgi:ribosome maturation factor RimP